jgi:hypothetical protein
MARKQVIPQKYQVWIDAEVKRLVKVSHIAATIGRVMWVWFRHQRKAEEEESSG